MRHQFQRLLRAAVWAAAAGAVIALVVGPASAGGPSAERVFVPRASVGISTVATLPSGFQDTTVMSAGLSFPTAMRFAPDGRIFVAQKDGRLLEFDSLSDTTPTTVIDLRTVVDNYWDRGLLGLAVDPNFPASPYLYVSYTYDAPPGQTAPVWNDACPTPPGPNTDGCVVQGRLSRLTIGANSVATNEQVLIQDWCQQFPSHSIGDIHFGADGYLYASGGDGASFTSADWGQFGGSSGSPTPANPCGDPPSPKGTALSPPTAEGGALRSQSPLRASGEPRDLDGAIIRVDPATGAGVPTNPLGSSSDADARRLVAVGMRNPFRFTIKPGTNDLWIGDVGWNTWEEINHLPNPLATPITNFGWPCYEGVGPMSTYQNAGLNICNTLYSSGGGGGSTFGTITIGSSTDTASVDLKEVSKYTAVAGNVTKLTGYVSGLGSTSGSQNVKAIIYADNGGAPGARLGVSNEVTINAGRAWAWTDFSFPTPVAVQSGPIWMGYIASSKGDLTQLRYDPLTGDLRYNANSGGYAAGPTNPFGTATTSNKHYSLYATTSSGSTSLVTAPYFTYNHSSAVVSGDNCPTGGSSITGVSFYNGGSYPSTYNGALFFGDNARRCIWAMMPGANGLPDPNQIIPFDVPVGSVTDIETGPGGDIFYVDYQDSQIHRITFAGGNQPPIAVATGSPTSGPAPLTVNFDGSGSSDPDGDPITYSWDLNGDGVYGDSTAVKPTFTYTTPGNVTVRLKVTDSHGASTISAPITISSGNTPPTATIGQPAPTVTWKVGDSINFSGSATDAQDGTIPASGLSWALIVHHCPTPNNCHTHQIQTWNGVAGGTFNAPDHEYPCWLELQLTATDSGGLTSTTSVRLDPQTVDLTFASSPTGAQLSAGSTSGAAPFTKTVVINSSVGVSALSPQTIGTNTYAFSSWSDGGAASHTITAPATATTYTATFTQQTTQTFGTTTIGSSTDTASVDLKEVSKYTAVAGNVTKLTGYVSGLGSTSGSQNVKAIIYADNGGAPGARLGVSNEVTINAGRAWAWTDFSFPTPVAVQSGPIWMGYIASSKGDLTQLRYDPLTGDLRYNTNSGGYAAGPTNPFGTATTSNKHYSLYATFT